VQPSSSTTLVIVPRESFSVARRCMEHVVRAVARETRVVCVDGGSPRKVRRYLEQVARAHDFTLLRSDRFLTPNEARNRALSAVTTEFVLFIDYETILPPGAIAVLEGCARRTGASIVGPVYTERGAKGDVVHMAGGDDHIAQVDGRRAFIDTHHHAGEPTADLRALVACPTEQVEFHCMLVRRDVFDTLGRLDEGLVSLREHSDLCLEVREHGGTVWLEPSVAVAYEKPRWPGLADRTYWLVRWSDEWNRSSLDHFTQKWGLADDDPATDDVLAWARMHRRYCYRPYVSAVSRCFGRRRAAVYEWVEPRAQRLALRRHRARAMRSGETRVVHRAAWLSDAVGNA
jgi:hypothetical protein